MSMEKGQQRWSDKVIRSRRACIEFMLVELRQRFFLFDLSVFCFSMWFLSKASRPSLRRDRSNTSSVDIVDRPACLIPDYQPVHCHSKVGKFAYLAKLFKSVLTFSVNKESC